MLTSISKSRIDNQAVNFAAFLQKPVKQSQLYSVLRSIFSDQPIKVRQVNSASSHTELYSVIETDKQHSLCHRISPSLVSANCYQSNSQLTQQLPLRILLAEDHPVNQKMALLLLQRMGYRADVTSNGIEVLEALHRQLYDVVLMDIQMPELDGLATTRRIAVEWPSDLQPRIIAMTANAMLGDREQCLEAGMDDYISKPIRVEELIQALGKCKPKRDGEMGSFQPIPLPPNPPASPTSQSPLNARVLQEFRDMAGEDAEAFLTEMIDCYLEESAKLLQAMEHAAVLGDGAGLQGAAHMLKSSSASLGAITLSNFCKELEVMGRGGTTCDASEILLQVEAEYRTVKAALLIERNREQV